MSEPSTTPSGSEQPDTEPSGNADGASPVPDGAANDAAGGSNASPAVEAGTTTSGQCTHPAVTRACTDGYCRIEPGCFVMGAPRTEAHVGKYADRQVQVTLTHAFVAGQFEITREQWQDAGFALPSRAAASEQPALCAEPGCPIAHVSFFDAAAFANRLSEASQLQPCYDLSACAGAVGIDLFCPSLKITAESLYACSGYRLPMEAEWEYMARAGTTTAYFTGDITLNAEGGDCWSDSNLDPTGWYCDNSDGRAHEVGQKQANGWGLHDTAGNVAELCNDIYHPDGYGEGPLVDPTGRLTPGVELMPIEHPWGELADPPRIGRGGWYGSRPISCKSNFRTYYGDTVAGVEHDTSPGLGFRLVRTLL